MASDQRQFGVVILQLDLLGLSQQRYRVLDIITQEQKTVEVLFQHLVPINYNVRSVNICGQCSFFLL